MQFFAHPGKIQTNAHSAATPSNRSRSSAADKVEAHLGLDAQLQQDRIEDECATDAQQPRREAGKRHHCHHLCQTLVCLPLACTPTTAHFTNSWVCTHPCHLSLSVILIPLNMNHPCCLCPLTTRGQCARPRTSRSLSRSG